jgi:hypothetical protein
LKEEPNLVLFETTDQYYLPSGRSIQASGVVPDFEVFRSPDPPDFEKHFEREEDFVPFTIAADGPKWIPIRHPEIEKCLNANPRAEAIHRFREGQGKLSDYQLLKSEEILVCSMSGTTRHARGDQ